MIPPPPRSTLFPYTTLFRSDPRADDVGFGDKHCRPFADAQEILRSEEHTSELQSRRDLVCRLLLEKKKLPSRMTYDWTESTLRLSYRGTAMLTRSVSAVARL